MSLAEHSFSPNKEFLSVSRVELYKFYNGLSLMIKQDLSGGVDTDSKMTPNSFQEFISKRISQLSAGAAAGTVGFSDRVRQILDAQVNKDKPLLPEVIYQLDSIVAGEKSKYEI